MARSVNRSVAREIDSEQVGQIRVHDHEYDP
jgi:hypothetical protein